KKATRKHRAKENEVVEQYNAHLVKKREQKYQRRSKETSKEHEKHLKWDYNYKKKFETETAKQYKENLKC
ncbi:10032_t:CDS:1, partial [Gigaspora margarita]